MKCEVSCQINRVYYGSYSLFVDPTATSCVNHYSAGRSINGEYCIKVRGVTFKVVFYLLLLILLHMSCIITPLFFLDNAACRVRTGHGI